MLERTFIHIPGIGKRTEQELWSAGCHSWSDLAKGLDRFSVGSAAREDVVTHLEASQRSLEEGWHQYFARRLGQTEAWRAWPEFRKSCVYLDIETDGGNSGEAVTTVGLYDGTDFACLIRGEDLGNFPDIISQYSMIVTFFGTGFDLPVLQKRFPTMRLDQIHLDLCPALKKVGLRGGLKVIEQRVGIVRSPETAGLTGRDAIGLWRRFERGSDAALDTLIAYNREDVVNLERLTALAYQRLKRASFDTFANLAQPGLELL